MFARSTVSLLGLLATLACSGSRPANGPPTDPSAVTAGSAHPPATKGVAPAHPRDSTPRTHLSSTVSASQGRSAGATSSKGRPAGGAVPPTVTLLHERSNTSWLGVELRATPATQAGVEVVRVLGGSPAEKAHIQVGDVLTTLGDRPVTRPAEVGNLVRQSSPGTTLSVGLLRGGQQRLVRIQLEGMPDFEDRLRLTFVGKRAPELHGVITFQGEAASLRELRGEVVVLEFWASFCQVCRVMAPMFDEWQRTFAPQGAQVVGITVDAPEEGLKVARSAGMSYTLASDPEARVTRQYLASQIPTVFVIDKQGVVRDAMVGYSQERLTETRALIQQLLGEPS